MGTPTSRSTLVLAMAQAMRTLAPELTRPHMLPVLQRLRPRDEARLLRAAWELQQSSDAVQVVAQRPSTLEALAESGDAERFLHLCSQLSARGDVALTHRKFDTLLGALARNREMKSLARTMQFMRRHVGPLDESNAWSVMSGLVGGHDLWHARELHQMLRQNPHARISRVRLERPPSALSVGSTGVEPGSDEYDHVDRLLQTDQVPLPFEMNEALLREDLAVRQDIEDTLELLRLHASEGAYDEVRRHRRMLCTRQRVSQPARAANTSVARAAQSARVLRQVQQDLLAVLRPWSLEHGSPDKEEGEEENKKDKKENNDTAETDPVAATIRRVFESARQQDRRRVRQRRLKALATRVAVLTQLRERSMPIDEVRDMAHVLCVDIDGVFDGPTVSMETAQAVQDSIHIPLWQELGHGDLQMETRDFFASEDSSGSATTTTLGVENPEHTQRTQYLQRRHQLTHWHAHATSVSADTGVHVDTADFLDTGCCDLSDMLENQDAAVARDFFFRLQTRMIEEVLPKCSALPLDNSTWPVFTRVTPAATQLSRYLHSIAVATSCRVLLMSPVMSLDLLDATLVHLSVLYAVDTRVRQGQWAHVLALARVALADHTRREHALRQGRHLSPRVVFLNGHSDTLSVQACNYICTVALAADDWYTLALLFASPLVPAEFKVLVPRDFAHKRQLSEVPEAQVSQILWHPSDHSKQLRRAAAEAAANAAAAKAAAAKVADATTADYDDDYALHDDDTDEDDEDYVTAFDGNSSAPDTLARHFVIEDEKRVFKLLTRAREYAYDVLGASSSATSARVVPVDEPPYSHTPSVLACPMLHLPRVLWRKSASQKALHRQQPDDADDARCDLMLPLAPLYALDSVLLEMAQRDNDDDWLLSPRQLLNSSTENDRASASDAEAERSLRRLLMRILEGGATNKRLRQHWNEWLPLLNDLRDEHAAHARKLQPE